MASNKMSFGKRLTTALVFGASVNGTATSNEIGPLLNADDGDFSLGLGYYLMRTNGLEYEGADSAGVTDLIEQDAYFARLRYQFMDGWTISVSAARDRVRNEPPRSSVSQFATDRLTAYGLSVEGSIFESNGISAGPFLQYTQYADTNLSGPVYANGFTNDVNVDVSNFYSARFGGILQKTFDSTRAYGALYYYQSGADLTGSYGGTSTGIQINGEIEDDNNLGIALGFNAAVAENVSFNLEGHYRHEPGMVLSVNFHPTKKARPAPQPTVEVVEKVVVVEKPAEASPLNLEDHNSTMYFEKGSSELTKADFLEIKKISDYLHDQPNSKAYIEGHCDCDGPDDLNLQLSEERANSVRQVLLDYHGIAEDRVLIEAYGEKFPVATNDTEEGRQQNRRVRVVVTNDPWL